MLKQIGFATVSIPGEDSEARQFYCELGEEQIQAAALVLENIEALSADDQRDVLEKIMMFKGTGVYSDAIEMFNDRQENVRVHWGRDILYVPDETQVLQDALALLVKFKS